METLLLLIMLCIIVLVVFLLEYYKLISLRVGMILYILSIFIVSFVHTPNGDGDLSRYFLILQGMKGTAIGSSTSVLIGKELFIANIIFWIIGNIGIYHLLPAISATTVYGIGLYIINDTSKKSHSTNQAAILLLFQFMQLPLFSIIENVRNIWAFSIIIMAVYRDVVQNKRDICTFALYIIPCFIHSSVYLLIIFRLLLPLVKRIIFILPVFSFFIREIINFLYMYSDKFPSLIGNSFIRAYQYTNSYNDQWGMFVANSTFFRLQRIVIMITVVCLIIIFYMVRTKLNKDSGEFCYFTFVLLIAVLSSNIFVQPHYWRYYSAVVLCVPVFISSLFQLRSRNKIKYDITKYFLILSSLLMFIINSYGAVTGL